MSGNRVLAAMVVVLLLATALRFYRLDSQSFWNDEGNSARLSERSPRLIVEGTASDIHPPFYYLALRGWRELGGETELGLRSFSVYFGLGLVALTFKLGKQLLDPGGDKPALLAALLVAVNPALVYYSQEARMYELLAFWAVLSTLLLLKLLLSSGSRLGLASAYTICVAAGLYTHYFFPAVLVAQALVVLYWILWVHRIETNRVPEVPGNLNSRANRYVSTFRGLLPWLLALVAALVFYSPWIPIFLRTAGGRSGERVSLIEFLPKIGRWLTFGATIDPKLIRWPLLALLLLAAVGLVALIVGSSRRPRRSLAAVVLLSTLLSPIIFMWALGTTDPAFYKFILMAIPSLSILVATGWWWVWKMIPRRASSVLWRIAWILLLVVSLWGSARSLQNMYFEPAYARADYRSMASRIAAEAYTNAAVILDAPNQWEVFTYYHKDGAPVYPLPLGRPDPETIDATLAEIAAEHDRVYAIFWGDALRDPQRLVERWLDAHAFKASDEWVMDVRFVTYSVPRDPNVEMNTVADLAFGDDINLLGYTLHSDNVTTGDILQLTLYWQSLQELDQRYKVFLHLVDENGHIVAQRDSEPGGGLALTTTWRPGDTVIDNHGLLIPQGTESGQYQLLLGLYELGNPLVRLPIGSPGGHADAFNLGEIVIDN